MSCKKEIQTRAYPNKINRAWKEFEFGLNSVSPHVLELGLILKQRFKHGSSLLLLVRPCRGTVQAQACLNCVWYFYLIHFVFGKGLTTFLYNVATLIKYSESFIHKVT
jgi:hypothetical protein